MYICLYHTYTYANPQLTTMHAEMSLSQVTRVELAATRVELTGTGVELVGTGDGALHSLQIMLQVQEDWKKSKAAFIAPIAMELKPTTPSWREMFGALRDSWQSGDLVEDMKPQVTVDLRWSEGGFHRNGRRVRGGGFADLQDLSQNQQTSTK